MSVDLLVVGGGRMGSALVGGLLSSGAIDEGACAIVERDASVCEGLRERFPGVLVTAEAPPAQGAILAVKPGDASAACDVVRGSGASRVLSILAGIRLERLEALLPDAAVLRAMPNTPALVGEGASAVAPGARASEADLEWAEALLASVGTVVRLSEYQLDAVTGLSGSGPAYVFLVAEALIDAGVLAGLERTVAERLTVATLLGASRMLAESGTSAEELRAGVTSPGGTTAAALRVLEQRGLRAAFLDAVSAASERSRELGA